MNFKNFYKNIIILSVGNSTLPKKKFFIKEKPHDILYKDFNWLIAGICDWNIFPFLTDQLQ